MSTPGTRNVVDASHLLGQYKKAVDVSTIVSKTDLKGIITYANDEFCRIAKYTEEELLGKPHNIVRHPDVPPAVFKTMWETIQSGQVWKGIVPNRAKDGSTYIVDATVVPIVDEAGEIREYIAIRKNITELMEQKSLLEQYKAAVDASNIVSKTDSKGVITYANNEFCRIAKYSKEELIGKPHNIVRHPDVPASVFKELWQTIQAGRIWKGVVPNRAKDGSTYVVDATIVPIKGEGDTIHEYIAIRHEITHLVENQKRLDERSEDLLQQVSKAVDIGMEEVVGHIPLPAVAVDGDDVVLAHNAHFDALFDMVSDDLLIQSLREGKLVLSTLFEEGEGLISFDAVFDWKLMFDPESARVRLNTGSGGQLFRVAMDLYGDGEAEKFIVCFLEL